MMTGQLTGHIVYKHISTPNMSVVTSQLTNYRVYKYIFTPMSVMTGHVTSQQYVQIHFHSYMRYTRPHAYVDF